MVGDSVKEASQILKQYIEKNDTVIAAISGGPDSMALLSLLVSLKEEMPITIVCAHVNHKVRKESDEEAVFVEEYCKKKNVLFEQMSILEYDHTNFHQYAREKRYAFFDHLMQKYKGKILLTAHHGDDLMESILMRIERGSTLKGYSGFSIVSQRNNYTILRPLYYETKASILEYNEKNQINYVTDSSNFKDIYTRNRYRMHILPKLKEENENIHRKFIKFSQTLEETNAYLQKEIEKAFSRNYQNQQIDLSSFCLEDPFIQKGIIRRIFEELYKDDLEKIEERHVTAVMELIASSMTVLKINLPKKIVCKKDRGVLFFTEEQEVSSYEIEFEKKVLLPNGKVIEQIKTSKGNTNFICRLSSKEVALPLVLRTRKEGDKMQVKHMEGTKKINDIFTDLKVPLDKRDTWPILVDQKGNILWLPGLKKSKFDIEKDIKCDIILKYY